jgi:hypothetical protein
MMEVNMEQCCARGLDATPQCRFDMVDVVKTLGAVQVDDQVDAGAADAVAGGEMIERLVGRSRRRYLELGLSLFLSRGASGGTWDPQALRRS